MKKIRYFKYSNNDRLCTFVLKKISFLSLLFGFILIHTSTYAQVTTQIDTTKIRIGEQIEYKIIVDQTDNILFTKFQTDSLRKIEVVESFKIDSLKNQLIKKYTLTSFDSGRWVLPPQKVLIDKKQFLTDSLIIDVATVAVDTIKQPMYHIKSIVNEPYTFADFKNYFWGLLLLLLVIGVILYFIFRKKPKQLEEIEKMPPFDLAKQRLKELDSKSLIKQNRIKLYYVELTDIVRTFIEREMNIPALESTTDELLDIINDFNESSKLNIPSEVIDKLKKLLTEADLVKFAKSKPLLNEIELHRNDAETIIDKLHPEPEITEEQEIKTDDHVE